MAQKLSGDDLLFMSVKFLLKDIPEDVQVSENNIRMSLKQKKYSPLWIMLKFMDSSSALVAVRVPRKSKNSDFVATVRGQPVKAVKLNEVEEAEYELMLNSTTAKMFSSTSNLRETIENTMTEMMQVENNDLFEGKRGDIKSDLLAATSQHYQVYTFGSRIIGLGLKNSDYDVFIDMENYYRGGGETKMENSVQRIRDQLRRNKAFSDFILIPRARVPVLKVKHCKTQIHCDISTVNGIGVENSKLLRHYLAERRIRFAATAVKLWARELGLTQVAMGPGSISSYCLLWLLLYAMMQDSPPVVHPVYKLKQLYSGPKLFVDGWDCSHCDFSHPSTKNNRNEIELLYYFFSFYGSLTIKDISQNVICPYLGTMIPLNEFVKTKSLPYEFENYKKQAAKHKFYEMNCDSFMFVQDPIEQNHNIAKAVESWVVDRFLKLCKTTAELMESSMSKDLHYSPLKR